MVKPNTVGNTGAASNGNGWEGLTSIKMGTAHGEVMENKKASLASKWEAWKARRAEDKARKAYDKKFDENPEAARKTDEEQNGLFQEKAETYLQFPIHNVAFYKILFLLMSFVHNLTTAL